MVLCYGKEKFSLIFPSTGFSVNYDVNLHKLNLKYIRVFPKQLILGTYVKFSIAKLLNTHYPNLLYLIMGINKLNKIIVKLVSSERSLTGNRNCLGDIP